MGQQPRVTPRTLIGLLQDNRGDECESTNMVEGGSDGEAEDMICVVLALDIHACKDSEFRACALAPQPHKGVRLLQSWYLLLLGSIPSGLDTVV